MELLIKIRETLDQIHTGTVTVSSNDELYGAIVHPDCIRIQVISKSSSDVLEFMDCEYYWRSQDITKAEFCRLQTNSANGTRITVDSSDAFDIIYRAVVRLSIDLATNKCQVSRHR
jgi:hypothetical protein